MKYSSFACGRLFLKLAVLGLPSRRVAPSAGIPETHQNSKRRPEQILRLRPNAYAWSVPALGLILVLAAGGLTRASVPVASTDEVTITSEGSTRYQGQVMTADDNVMFQASGVKIIADHAEYDLSNRTLQASGHVLVIEGDEVYRGDSVTYNLSANTIDVSANNTSSK